MRKPLVTLPALAAFAAACAFAAPGAAPDPDRGRALYETRCLGCHGESVHSREKRAARDFASIRAWVARWNDTLRAGWGSDEVDDVTAYLNATYYRYPCPPTVCKVLSELSYPANRTAPPPAPLTHINREGGLAPYRGGR